MKYRILEKAICYQGFFRMECCTIEHETFDGGMLRVRRENLERGDAVAVLLYDAERDEVLLLEQFRVGPAMRDEHPWMLEIVAGMIDADESEEQAARRESLEEAGYMPEALHFLARYYVSPGGTSERISLYLAQVDRHRPYGEGGGMRKEQEDIRLFWCARRQAMQWLAQGRIRSGAPMLALLLAFGYEGAHVCG